MSSKPGCDGPGPHSRPAFRAGVQTFDELVARARSLVIGDERAVLAVVGAPGSGKSTLTSALLHALRAGLAAGTGGVDGMAGAGDPEWVAHLPMDGFHLADVELDRLGRRGRKGAVDTFDAAGYVATLRRIRERTDEIVYAPGFERDLEQPIAASIPVPRVARLVVTEGLYLLHDRGPWAEAAGFFAESWFVEVDDERRRTRLVDRHVTFGKSPAEARDWVAQVDEVNSRLVAGSAPRATLRIDPDTLHLQRT